MKRDARQRLPPVWYSWNHFGGVDLRPLSSESLLSDVRLACTLMSSRKRVRYQRYWKHCRTHHYFIRFLITRGESGLNYRALRGVRSAPVLQ